MIKCKDSKLSNKSFVCVCVSVRACVSACVAGAGGGIYYV